MAQRPTPRDFLGISAKANTPFLHPGGAAATLQLIHLLQLENGQSVLDYGCGTGATLQVISRQFDLELTGIDIRERMLLAAGKRLKDTDVRLIKVAPRKTLPFDDASFERILAESVFGFHEPSQVTFMLTEACRILKPGGLMIINDAVWNAHTDVHTINEIIEGTTRAFGCPPASPAGWSGEDWVKAITACGFSVEKPIAVETTDVSDTPSIRQRLMQQIRNPWQWYRFKKSLRRWAGTGQYLSAFIFVMRKPI